MKHIKIFSLTSEYETSKSGGTLITPNVSLINEDNSVRYLPELDDPYNGHEYVEIGGLKWATMNIGATSPEEAGLYFAWGDTQGYITEQIGSNEGQKYFRWEDYKYGDGTSSPDDIGMTKYNETDGKTILEASDDAAVANWGGSWRMPTDDEFRALRAAVNATWTQVNNVYGMLFTDKTDESKTLFFPAAGSCYNGVVGDVDNDGNYWSSSLDTDGSRFAYSLYLDVRDDYWGGGSDRCSGYTIRPVVG